MRERERSENSHHWSHCSHWSGGNLRKRARYFPKTARGDPVNILTGDQKRPAAAMARSMGRSGGASAGSASPGQHDSNRVSAPSRHVSALNRRVSNGSSNRTMYGELLNPKSTTTSLLGATPKIPEMLSRFEVLSVAQARIETNMNGDTRANVRSRWRVRQLQMIFSDQCLWVQNPELVSRFLGLHNLGPTVSKRAQFRDGKWPSHLRRQHALVLPFAHVMVLGDPQCPPSPSSSSPSSSSSSSSTYQAMAGRDTSQTSWYCATYLRPGVYEFEHIARGLQELSTAPASRTWSNKWRIWPAKSTKTCTIGPKGAVAPGNWSVWNST